MCYWPLEEDDDDNYGFLFEVNLLPLKEEDDGSFPAVSSLRAIVLQTLVPNISPLVSPGPATAPPA